MSNALPAERRVRRSAGAAACTGDGCVTHRALIHLPRVLMVVEARASLMRLRMSVMLAKSVTARRPDLLASAVVDSGACTTAIQIPTT